MGETCGSTRIVAAFMVFFLLTTIALVAYIIYEKTTEEDIVKETLVVNRYPGYFRTPMEQAAFEAQIQPVISEQNATVVPEKNNTRLEGCKLDCFETPNKPQRKRRSAHTFKSMILTMSSIHLLTKRDTESTLWASSYIYHGCCISRHKFISPNTLPNRYNQERVIVQFNDRRQYFLTQECRHAEGCTGCTCKQEKTLVTAVVENVEYPDNSDDEYVLELVELGGCCKCFNS